MKSTKRYLYILLAITFPLTLLFPFTGKAVALLPGSDLAWKNISVNGKKTTVFCIYKDSRGLVWLGTNSGLYFYDGVAAKAVCGNEMLDFQIYSMVEKDGHLFLGSNNGLLIYDFKTGNIEQPLHASPKEIRSLLLVDDILWMGSLFGMYTFNTDTAEIRDLSKGLPHKSVYSLLRDSRGILYAGTYNGLARWNAGKEEFQKVPVEVKGEGVRDIFVNTLLEADDNKTIYVGSEGTLYSYSPAREWWEKIPAVDGNNIKSLAKTAAGHLLVGSDNGVFDLHQDFFHHYRHDSRHEQTISDNEIWCIYSDNKDNIWIGHEKGISIASNSNSIRTTKLSTLSHSGEGNEIHSIYRDSDNNLWLGGTNGVIRLSKEAAPQWYRHSGSKHSISHNRIRAIDEDSENNIWLSTDGGINRYNPSTNSFDVFHIVDEKGEHNSNWVYALEEDGDSFWVGSYLGGLHYVAKSKFGKPGGTVVSDHAVNADATSFKGIEVALRNDLVNNVVKDSSGNIWILLFRDHTLTRLSPRKDCMKYDILKLTGSHPTHIATDNRGRLWCAFSGGVVMFDKDNAHHIVRFPHTDEDEGVLAIGKVGEDVWVSTQSNVWKIDGETLTVSLLPIPQKAYTALFDDKLTGKVYLGGNDEILEVNPDKLGNDSEFNTIKMVLKDQGNGHFNLFSLKCDEEGLTIPYGGSLTLVVSTLDYSSQSLQRYAYKLMKSQADTGGEWIVMPEGANTITFSNLSMGSYELLIKTIGAPVTPCSVPLKVESPWFLSWWAICIYGLIVVFSVLCVIRYVHKRNMRKLHAEERRRALENAEKKLTFLSAISHDLKTPLSMILGPASMLKERTKDLENRKSLEIIYDNAVKLNNMIHRTLELRHLEDVDENLLILSTFDVVEFCKGVFESFKENNPHKNFIFHSSCSQLFIEADVVKFESVMTNLLSNACKYSEDDSTISCGISMNEEHVEIVVSDDGVGIDEADQPLVFQRMFRALSTAKLHEGTGIGLYLIKKYLELMNGNIDLYSRKGQGTSFIVTLPLSKSSLPKQHSETEDVNDSRMPKILIVEDNLQISMFIKDLLKKDYTCLLAENGRAGLSLASSFVPDLIILDEMMPIMKGTEMVRYLKQNPRLALIPIIMLTAKSDNITESESVKLGIDAFMSKPFEPSILLGRISHLVKMKRELRKTVRIEAKPIEAESVVEKQIAKIAKIIDENISDPGLNVNLLCEKSGIPNKQLYRIIKKYIGVAPLDYIRQVRLQKAAMLLAQHRFTVSEVSYMVGFNTPSYFTKCFQSQFGMKPSQYQSEGENSTLSDGVEHE